MIVPKFLDPLDVRKLPGGVWQLRAELRYDSAVMGARLIIPAGFLYDMASVPRLPFAFWLAGDTAHAASCVHDFLYRMRLASHPDQNRRRLADAVFFEAMTCESVPPWRRALMWAAVRLFGARPWRAHP